MNHNNGIVVKSKGDESQDYLDDIVSNRDYSCSEEG